MQFMVRSCLTGYRDRRDEIPRKPDPAGVFYVAKKLGVDYKECLYVGDSEVDVVTGKNAGVKTIAVTWGFQYERRVNDCRSPVYDRQGREIAGISIKRRLRGNE